MGSAQEAIRGIQGFRPDLVLMDASMPQMDGVEATRRLLAIYPTRIILFTAATGAELRRFKITGLSAGASYVLQKEAPGAALRDRIVALATNRRLPSSPSPSAHPRSAPARAEQQPDKRPRPSVVGIVSSTGGPQTLLRVLRPLPQSFPVGLVLVQHMEAGFEATFCETLSRNLSLSVSVARAGDPVRPGALLIAPPNAHMMIRSGRVVLDERSPAENNHRPSGDRLLRSLASTYRSSAWGIVLTGMGRDGAAGLKELSQAGGYTIAQDAETAIVDGMPRAARENGAAQKVLPDSEIGRELIRQIERTL